MRRDMDLIRRIALETAELQEGAVLRGIEGVDPTTFVYHVRWMKEANLLVTMEVTTFNSKNPQIRVERLTWDGCEFADAARNEALWQKAKEKVLIPSASWTFGALRDWLAREIREGLASLG
jgi:hypothetical protein